MQVFVLSVHCLAEVQMVMVYNVNFGPWLSANNLGQKREVLKEYLQLHTSPPEDGSSNLGTPLRHLPATYHRSRWPVAAAYLHPVPLYVY